MSRDHDLAPMEANEAGGDNDPYPVPILRYYAIEEEDSNLSPHANELDAATPHVADMNKEVEFQYNSVSGLNECLSKYANKLCIFDLPDKLIHSDHYDIGGTYSIHNSLKKPDLWFYCTTSVCPNSKYILNIFVCHRNIGSFIIGISDRKVIKRNKTTGRDKRFSYFSLPNTLSWKTYKSSEIDESHHVKSYSFTKEDLLLDNTLVIPIEIRLKLKCAIDKEVLCRIKMKHDLSNLFKRQENTDFVIESTSGRKYGVHKILLAARSSVLRELLRGTTSNNLIIDLTDDGMEYFLEYMYTGLVKDISEKNCGQLIDISEKFKLDQLFKETELAITKQISVPNAISIAVLSEKYKLDKIQQQVFQFIKDNPAVLESDGWHKLNDINVAKKLFKKLYFVDST